MRIPFLNRNPEFLDRVESYFYSSDLGCQGLYQNINHSWLPSLSPLHKTKVKISFIVPEVYTLVANGALSRVAIDRSDVENVRKLFEYNYSQEIGTNQIGFVLGQFETVEIQCQKDKC